MHPEERRLAARLRHLERETAKPQRELEALARDAARRGAGRPERALSSADVARVEAALEAQHAGLAKLIDVARRDLRDMEIMRGVKGAAPPVHLAPAHRAAAPAYGGAHHAAPAYGGAHRAAWP